MKVACYQAPIAATVSIDGALEHLREQVRVCERIGVSVLCCPEAMLGGLADYVPNPTSMAVPTTRIAPILAPLASPTVACIVGFTELAEEGCLFNSAAIVLDGSVLGVYRKLHPAINQSIYQPGEDVPVFSVERLTFGVVICNDSNYLEPFRLIATQGATVAFVLSNNGLPVRINARKVATASRKTDLARAMEHGLWIVRSDVAGRVGLLESVGSADIVNPDEVVIAAARGCAAGLFVADLDSGTAVKTSGMETVER
jgi:5-aminopentanamidase